MLIVIPYTVVFLLVVFLSRNMTYNNNGLSDHEGQAIKPLRERNFFLILCVVFFFSAFRHIQAPAIDEWLYRPRINVFRGISLTTALSFNYDKGMSVMYWIGAKLFATDQGSMIISTIFTIPALLIGLRKHCYDFRIGIAMLFLTGYIAAEFNGISQCIATAIFVLFFETVYDRKFVKYCLVVLICISFHHASWFLIPVYFFARTEHGTPRNILLSIIFLAFVVLAYRLLPNYADMVGLNEYAYRALSDQRGVRLISIAVSILPASFSLFLPRSVVEKDRITNAVSNMVVIHAVIALASSLDVYIARFELFTAPFISIFYSRFIRYMQNKNKKLFFVILGIAYYIVFVYTYRKEYYYFQFV